MRSRPDCLVATRLAILVAPLGMSGCLVRNVPAPSPPKEDMPVVDLPASKPPAGSARVLVSTDVPARVGLAARHARAADMSGGTSHEIEGTSCDATPCVLTLPYGEHVLRFEGTRGGGRTSTAEVAVRNDVVVVNHTLGKSELGSSFIYGLGMIGVGLVGLATTFGPLAPDSSSTEVKTAKILLFGSFTVAGGAAICLTTRTEQEGATTQWVPKPSERPRELAVSIRGSF
jgi:hypothetical protein